MSKKILGIDLGGTSVKFAIISSEGEIQEKWTIGTNWDTIKIRKGKGDNVAANPRP